MRVGQDFYPKSSFLSVEKDLALIFQKLTESQRLLKLLYYPQRDCLKAPDLTRQQIENLLNKQIRIVPTFPLMNEQTGELDPTCPNFMIVEFDTFVQNASNPEFRNNTIKFDILCDPEQWNLGNFALRPYRIAGEIDSLFNKKKLTGIGETYFVSANELILGPKMMGLTLTYIVIHGVEDQINPLYG